MEAKQAGELMRRVTEGLAATCDEERRLALRRCSAMPSVDAVATLMTLLRRVLFPGYFDAEPVVEPARLHHVGVDLERVMITLKRQVAAALVFAGYRDRVERCVDAADIALRFIEALPALRDTLLTDVEAVALNDPAVTSLSEVIFSYPVTTVMLHYRVAHLLHTLGVPILPRIITEMAHSATGVDIHPAATIGRYFAIDHGTGVVIGATAVIGDHVMLYQGVTLGARNFERDDSGHPLDVPRHPVIEDRVVVYSNASILGRITIGHDSVIGGNVWVTHDVPPHSRVLQGKLIEQPFFTDGAGI